MKKIILALFLTVIVISSFNGCTVGSDRTSIINSYIGLVFTCPNEQLIKADDEFMKILSGDISPNDAKTNPVTDELTLLFSDLTTQAQLEKIISLDEIMKYNQTAREEGFLTTPKNITITKDKKDSNLYQVEFDLEIVQDGETKVIKTTSSVQFDKDRISYFNIHTKEVVKTLLRLDK